MRGFCVFINSLKHIKTLYITIQNYNVPHTKATMRIYKNLRELFKPKIYKNGINPQYQYYTGGDGIRY